MRLVDYLDKGASIDPSGPCLTTDGQTLSYQEVQQTSNLVARALVASGVRPGDKVAILSANDPVAFSCVFGISRAGAVWCPINPRNEAAENQETLNRFDCVCLIYQSKFQALVDEIASGIPGLVTLVCLDGDVPGAVTMSEWTAGLDASTPAEPDYPDDIAMLVGTGGTTGLPKGVQLTNQNLETMTAIVLMSYPFTGRPRYLALAPLTHAAGVLCFPILALGGEIVIMRTPDTGQFLEHVERHRITHTFLPPTLIYMVLGHDNLTRTNLSSLQCFWYGAAPISTTRLAEALDRIGPVMAQLFGQSEAPMMISTMSPADHFTEGGDIATDRLASAGRPAPLVQVAIMDEEGTILDAGERGEIVVRSSLVMSGYYKDPDATAEATKFGWHHTGDIGRLDTDGYLYVVDRAKDMIITGGFNVYSTEVEQVMMSHPAIRDCAVIGMPDEKWGERITAVVQLQPGFTADAEELRAYARERLGGVKAPKQVLIWDDLPRSKVGKVLKTEIRANLG